MNKAKLRKRFFGLYNVLYRFPITVLFLLVIVITNAIIISSNDDDNFLKLIMSLAVGAFSYAVLQIIYERFLSGPSKRFLMMALSAIITVIYYIVLLNVDIYSDSTGIRTVVILFVLVVLFLWIPSINSGVSANETFMAAFKAFFIALFFMGVLFLGVALVLGTYDMLIMSIDGDAYIHAANIIFILLAPVYFLSIIPVYPRTDEKSEQVKPSDISDIKAVDKELGNKSLENANKELEHEQSLENANKELEHEQGLESANKEFEPKQSLYEMKASADKTLQPGKLLENLISYVFIPITAIYTVILLLYIIINITGELWTDSLLEPLLVSFSIIVIVVYLLASNIDSAIAKLFRLVFPKVLIPVVLFQTVSSAIKINEIGITYGRYYVIIFGVFATIAAIIFSILPIKSNGIIAPILIALSILSILPPVDAFTVSRLSQTGRLKKTLEANDMLKGNDIIPNAEISKEDKDVIKSSIDYLERMNYIKNIDWLSDYNDDKNFNSTFGFSRYGNDESYIDNKNFIRYFQREDNPISIAGYDVLLEESVSLYDASYLISGIMLNQSNYTLHLLNNSEEGNSIQLRNQAEEELINFKIIDIYTSFIDKEYDINRYSYEDTLISNAEATFTVENSNAILTIITNSINIDKWSNGENMRLQAYILVKLK